MYVSYNDIVQRIEQTPKWWCQGVPRYEEFRPADVTIYYPVALLVKGRCQGCHREFEVGLSGGVPRLIINERKFGHLQDDAPYHEIASEEGDPRCPGNWSSLLIFEVLEAWWKVPVEVKSPVLKRKVSAGFWAKLRHRRLAEEVSKVRHLGVWTRLPLLEGPQDFYAFTTSPKPSR